MGRRDPATETKSMGVAPKDDLFDWRTFEPEMLPGGVDAPLVAELITYRDRLDEMLRAHTGEFVIIQADRIVGYHPNRKEALKAAFEAFGRKPVLIKQVVEKEQVRRVGGVSG